MIYSETLKFDFITVRFTLWHLISAFFLCLLAVFSIYSQETTSIKAESGVDTISFGKDVVVEKGINAKNILVFGGNITIEGNVDEDVFAFGGVIDQKEDAFIGGDVFVVGGSYIHERKEALRNKDKQSIIFAVYENELRNIAQNPTRIFAPEFSWAFLAQRLLSTLFWFVISLFFATIAPGAVGRAVARFQLSTLKVVGLGLLTFVTATLGVTAAISFMPGYLSLVIVPMITILLMLSLVYGRVTLQVSLGKWLQKQLPSENTKRSETFAIFLGTVLWTVLTSIPYVWVLAVLFLFAASLGLVITARSNNSWQKV